jgi:fructose/tagatose bisphosphate aldolase
MSVVSMPEILTLAFKRRYGVGAFNIVNDLTMEAILEAAEKAKSPVIVQVSVKTVKMMGARLIQLMFQEMAERVSVPTTLHLDHCPDIDVITACLEAGWNSVLFDASRLSYEENLKQTQEVVALDKAVHFIRETGIDSFAPAIGTAHGMYKGEPKINFDRVTQIVEAQPIPIVLHGGTGLKVEVFRELIARGAAKVNISTQLKITFADSFKTYLDKHPTEYNPLKLLAFVRENVMSMAMGFFRIFGSEGKAS